MIALFDIGETFPGVTVLRDISLAIQEGEFFVVVGPSGYGRPTLLNLLIGLNEPGLDQRIVCHQYALFPWRTARENIEFGLEAKGISRRQRAAIASEHLHLAGLAGFADRYPHELSEGMKQRVAIARSLAYDPQVLLMDEPFAALDAQTRAHLQDELRRIWEQTGKTIVLLTHGIDEAVYLGQRVAVMASRPGRVRQIINVDLGERDGDVRSSARFQQFRQQIWSLLRGEAAPAQAQEALV